MELWAYHNSAASLKLENYIIRDTIPLQKYYAVKPLQHKKICPETQHTRGFTFAHCP